MNTLSISLMIIITLILAFFIFLRTYQRKITKQITDKQLGVLTEVEGHRMNIYIEGTGSKTLVFMSGGGTVSPLLDFKTLYSRLSKDFKIVVVEKFGYGFSDIVDKSRDIQSILEDTRTALIKNNLVPPYILCPHSMSGIEALYWKQLFPEEVSGIIGLDMATPEAYQNIKLKQKKFVTLSLLNQSGLSFFIPKNLMGDAVKHGALSIEEKKIYKIIFGTRFMSKTMRNEISEIKANGKKVNLCINNEIPTLLFISNGIGTGFGKKDWQQFQENLANHQMQSTIIILNCPHYLHNYEYDTISKEIANWLH